MSKELRKTSVKLAFAITVGALISPAAQASSIIGGSTLLNSASLSQLEGYLGEGQLDVTNIFTKHAASETQSASTSYDFHTAADGQGRTFSLLHVSGTEQALDGSKTQFSKVIGGYNPQSWSSINGYNLVFVPTQRSAFLFNLSDSTLFKENTILDPNSFDAGAFQTYNVASNGPIFGGGFDLYTDSTLTFGYTSSYSYSNNLPFTGLNPLLLGLAGNSINSNFGGNGFNIDDLEVFTIAHSPEVSSVPLPAALPLMSSALGLFGLGAARRKNKSLA